MPAAQAEAEFGRFWEAYPRKVGKAAARKAFARVQTDPAVLLDAVMAQRRSAQWTKDGGKYIPNPATWLNQGRWEDQLPPAVNDRNRIRAPEEYFEGLEDW